MHAPPRFEHRIALLASLSLSGWAISSCSDDPKPAQTSGMDGGGNTTSDGGAGGDASGSGGNGGEGAEASGSGGNGGSGGGGESGGAPADAGEEKDADIRDAEGGPCNCAPGDLQCAMRCAAADGGGSRDK